MKQMTDSSLLSEPTQAAEPVRDLLLIHDSKAVHLAEFKGHPVLLFVLGVDCGTCKQLARALSALRDEYFPHIEFFGICIQNACEEMLPEFASATAVNFLLTHCSNREICEALHIPRSRWLYFPTVIFLDAQQRLRGLFTGRDKFFEDASTNLREALDTLLAESKSAGEQMEATA
jgi:thiol-disulfide isomerase/thioredoxin